MGNVPHLEEKEHADSQKHHKAKENVEADGNLGVVVMMIVAEGAEGYGDKGEPTENNTKPSNNNNQQKKTKQNTKTKVCGPR